MRLFLLTVLAMLAFAANSLLCRLALKTTGIDPVSFTMVRLVSGAVVLALLVRAAARQPGAQDASAGSAGTWRSAGALFVYAIAFSVAYVQLPASTGALLLFGAVQATMIGWGLWQGERLRTMQWAGFLLAVAGLVGLLLPGLAAPPLAATGAMLLAGMAWGVYSLRGKGAGRPLEVTAGNFLRTVPMAALASTLAWILGWPAQLDVAGLVYALLSGAVASGLGYAVWYSALPLLRATSAATVQLSVPAIAAVGGVLLLGESLSVRLVLASVAILGGIAVVILSKE
ncbi:MAG: hypothetical protein RLZZ126_10 [Pseudomonadota bacterium]|jgi:drug/metabolite transporter (DMT)-like permease